LKMKKELLLFGVGFIFLMFVLPLALADSEINVRTVSGHRASITLLGTGETYEFIDSFHKNTGDTGKVVVNYLGDRGTLDVLVKITKDGETVISERFEDMGSTGPMYLQVIPGKVSSDYKKLDEEKAAAEAAKIAALEAEKVAASGEDAKESDDDSGTEGVTGSAISDFELKIPKSLYYVVGGLLVVGLLAFLGLKYGGGNKSFSPKSVTGSVGSSSVNRDKKNPAELKLENQLKEAQKEIARLKREEQNIAKIAEVQRKLEADKEELRKLRSGE
jgi:hypothetical protein